ncbi:hypothetical protein [Pectobacterium actinidiae]|uniref:hypothetical protein n=1 Tax=Pectobacterium actinidiae TaxID=1507808 RepID=UPI00383BED23
MSQKSAIAQKKHVLDKKSDKKWFVHQLPLFSSRFVFVPLHIFVPLPRQFRSVSWTRIYAAVEAVSCAIMALFLCYLVARARLGTAQTPLAPRPQAFGASFRRVHAAHPKLAISSA